MTAQDWVASYRIGSSHLRLASYHFVLGGTLFLIFLILFAVLDDGMKQAWHRHGTSPLHYLWTALPFLAAGPAAFIVLAVPLLWFASDRHITLGNQSVVTQVKGSRTPRHWRLVSCILKEADYIAICSGSFDALVIPRRAFSDDQAAEAFFNAAISLWNRSNNLFAPVHDDATVWPPAPRSGNSAELGDGPKG